MKNHPVKNPSGKVCKKQFGLYLLPLVFLATAAGYGLDFQLGDLDATLDTTVSYGTTYRLDDPDPKYYGLANGGEQYSVNADDGNLNYEKGVASSVLKVNADLELSQDNWGLFFRGVAFYDFENKDGDRARNPLSRQAMDKVGSNADILDAYLFLSFDVGDMPVDIRAGQQVLSWGESTFIQNGINVINPVDVSAIRIPGAELKEALTPVPMISFSWGITENITLEGFLQTKWQEIEVDPPGTYFSTNDLAGVGGELVWLGFGAIGDTASLGMVPRAPTRVASDSGQWGLATRILVPELNDTEFGIYYINYHSRLPVISGMTPTTPINTNLTGPFTMIFMQQGMDQASAASQAATTWGGLTALQLANAALTTPAAISDEQWTQLNNPTTPAGAFYTVIPLVPLAEAAQIYQTNPEALTPEQAALLTPENLATLNAYSALIAAVVPQLQALTSEQTGALIDGASQIAFLQAAASGRYFTEYPEDIKLLGFSFNTDLLKTGISLQGEISYRWDVPLQIDDVDLLFAVLSSINPGFAPPVNAVGNYLGQYGTYVQGYRLHDVIQYQATATKIFGPMMGADQMVFLTEIGATSVKGMPKKSDFAYEGSGTFTSANAIATMGGAQPVTTPIKAFADDFSWGYRMVARLDYSNVFAGVNLSPSIQFAHDVSGNTPIPLGNFLEGRKTLTLGVSATYLNAWEASLRYTNYFGAGEYNLLGDRDFVSATVKYSF